MHNARDGYGFPKEEIAMIKLIQYMLFLIQKGYMVLMQLLCVCGCNVMQGDRQIQN
jgi:hypothetical protein